jgi:hypothetical protein
VFLIEKASSLIGEATFQTGKASFLIGSARFLISEARFLISFAASLTTSMVHPSGEAVIARHFPALLVGATMQLVWSAVFPS